MSPQETPQVPKLVINAPEAIGSGDINDNGVQAEAPVGPAPTGEADYIPPPAPPPTPRLVPLSSPLPPSHANVAAVDGKKGKPDNPANSIEGDNHENQKLLALKQGLRSPPFTPPYDEDDENGDAAKDSQEADPSKPAPDDPPLPEIDEEIDEASDASKKRKFAPEAYPLNEYSPPMVCCVLDQWRAAPLAWVQGERATLSKMFKAISDGNKQRLEESETLPSRPTRAPKSLQPARTTPPRALRQAATHRPKLSVTRPTARQSAIMTSANSQQADSADEAQSAVVQPSNSQQTDSSSGPPSARTSPPRKPRQQRNAVVREDTKYDDLPNYCPPLLALDNLRNGFGVTWKGQCLDLSRDPDRTMLHKHELTMASTLRLSCATYLCSKRRIFAGYVDALKARKDFRKTSAQQACKIDVNKASRLWTAYEKVGWFNKDLFHQYLTPSENASSESDENIERPQSGENGENGVGQVAQAGESSENVESGENGDE